VDGGLLNNVPVDVVRKMGSDVILAVDVYTHKKGESFWQEVGHKRFLSGTVGELIAVLGDSLDLLIRQQNVNKLQNNPPDFLICPDIPVDVTIVTGYHRAAELISLGEEATGVILHDLQASLINFNQA